MIFPLNSNFQFLFQSDNYITSLPRNAFHSLRRLSTLDVSNNTIVEIGRAFVDMPELRYLDLSHNHLPAVREGAFKSLPRLISLRLDHNSVVELQSDAFQDLDSLESIALTKNGIPVRPNNSDYLNFPTNSMPYLFFSWQEVKRETFRDLPSLEVIRLDDNLITDLESRSGRIFDLFRQCFRDGTTKKFAGRSWTSTL